MRNLQNGDIAVVIDPDIEYYGKVVGVNGEVESDGSIVVTRPSNGDRYRVKRDTISHVDLRTALKIDMDVA